MFVSKAQDPMTLIHELLTTFSLYAKTRVDQKSHMSRNFNSIFASKRVWMQKTRSQWVCLTWSLCLIPLFFGPIFFFFCLGFSFVLHTIEFIGHTTLLPFLGLIRMFSKDFFFLNYKKIFCITHHQVCNWGWPINFSFHDFVPYLALMSYFLHFASLYYVVLNYVNCL